MIGRFTGDYETPTHNEVSICICNTWKDANGVQVYDMNGFKFLFEFLMRKIEEHIRLVRVKEAKHLQSGCIPTIKIDDWV